MQEIDKIKFLILDEEEIFAFKYLPGPNLIVEKRFEDEKIQYLWNTIQADNAKINSQNEIANLKNLVVEDNLSKEMKKLLYLI